MFPRQNKKASLIENLGSWGTGITLLFGIGMLLSPLVAKKSIPIAAFLGKIQSHAGFFRKVKSLNLNHFLSDRKNIENVFWRALAFSGLLSGLNNYQTAINTKQPSLFMHILIAYITNIALLFRPKSNLARSSAFLCFALLAVGKHNDIDNSNHPDKRREWELKRLTKPFRNKPDAVKAFWGEVKDFLRFIANDIQLTFSPTPWRELGKAYRNKKSLTTPQSYQTAIAGQLFALGFLTSQLAKIRNLTPALISAGGIIYNLPIFTRAWQNRHEPENKAMLLSIPVSVLADGFRAIPNLSYLTGVSTSSSVTGKALEINSRRYRAMLDYLDQLYHYAKEHPKVRAKDIFIEILSHKPLQKNLQQAMGKNRLEFLLKLLHDANLAESQHNIPLSSYLEPIVFPTSHKEHLSSGNPTSKA